MRTTVFVSTFALLVLCSCHPAAQQTSPESGGTQNNNMQTGKDNMALTISSTAFSNGGMIPSQYTCDGANISPPLQWSGIPAGTKTVALIVDDPDAPAKTWVHWVVYDLPANTAQLPENIKPQEKLAGGAKQGTNDFKKVGYGDHVHPVEPTDTSLSFMPSTLRLLSIPARQKMNCSRRWRVTFWRKAN
jgi:Raf kinase inhibitor-like YbhB/YbcL family protein